MVLWGVQNGLQVPKSSDGDSVHLGACLMHLVFVK